MEILGTLIDKALAAPTGSLLVIAGIVFLLIAVVGNISGKIEPGPTGRIAGGVIGLSLLIGGLTVFGTSRTTPPAQPTAPASGGGSAPAPSVTSTADRPATSVCGVLAVGIFSDSRDKRLQSQASLIQQCASDPAAISLVIDQARSNTGNRAGVYDALVYLDKIPENEMHDPALRSKIRDFAIAAAGNSADSAAISRRLDTRYR